ncbi:hypothetical protein [Romboutsia maritimum]|uniref:hypothetical protein n=1 Tax=Romboutsia maritimum TaxID=2020948 RepID=UPI001314FD4A|nr:hypothetical protein [Romboutsia maritimum]
MAKKQSLKLQVSFKENISDIEIYNYILEKGKIMGISSYIKILVAEDMKKNKE